MRQDIVKIFNERARSKGLPSSWPHRVELDEDNLPSRMSMRALHSKNWGRRAKSKNNMYSVAKRWLSAQVGRPWAAVYSDISRNIDTNSLAGQKLREYILNQVIQNAFIAENGRVMYVRWGECIEVCDWYVHPHTKVLMSQSIQTYRSAAKERASNREKAVADRRKVISDTVQLHKLNGVWFEVKLAPITPPKMVKLPYLNYEIASPYSICYDVVLRRSYAVLTSSLLQETYGHRSMYAAEKRQLSHKELKKYGLRQN